MLRTAIDNGLNRVQLFDRKGLLVVLERSRNSITRRLVGG